MDVVALVISFITLFFSVFVYLKHERKIKEYILREYQEKEDN